MENSEVSFYNRETLGLLKSDPRRVQDLLEKDRALNDLHGVEIWLVFDPSSYEQNGTYMTVATFYKDLLESKGATVRIKQSFQ
jgi:hypothetical protein